MAATEVVSSLRIQDGAQGIMHKKYHIAGVVIPHLHNKTAGPTIWERGARCLGLGYSSEQDKVFQPFSRLKLQYTVDGSRVLEINVVEFLSTENAEDIQAIVLLYDDMTALD